LCKVENVEHKENGLAYKRVRKFTPKTFKRIGVTTLKDFLNTDEVDNHYRVFVTCKPFWPNLRFSRTNALAFYKKS
jgi:hypothetical protein